MRLGFGLLREMRQAVRGLGRARGFALTAVVTLALGLAANVVVFGVLDALLLRPMPGVKHAEQLSFVQHGPAAPSLSFPQYLDLKERNGTFADMGAYDLVPVGVRVHGGAEQRWATLATGSYFDMLGVKPYLGRFFSAADDRRGANASPWAVLSYATWKRDFGGDPGIVGRVIELSKHPFTVLGVAPPGFYGTERFVQPALWADLWNEQQLIGFDLLHERSGQDIWVMGRRKPGVSVAQAQADLGRVARGLAKEYPDTDESLHPTLTEPGYLGTYLGGPLHAFLSGLMLLTGLVLLAACANLGGLYAARAADRSREMALRMALGASRARVARGLLLESLALAVAGGVVGCALARVALHALTNYRPPFDFPIAVAVDPGAGVYGFAALLALGAALACGLIPAREAMRAQPYEAMKTSAGSRAGWRMTLRDALLLLEVALCCVLVTASFVALRGLAEARHVRLGFTPGGVTLVSYDLDTAGYKGDRALRFNQKLAEGAAGIPGVESTAFTSDTPLNTVGQNSWDIFRAGTTDFRPRNIVSEPSLYDVSAGYFHTAGTRLLAGRGFTNEDDTKTPLVAVVNEQFARVMFGNRAAVGRVFLGGNRQPLRVVGVVEDGKYESLNEAPEPTVFRPAAQWPPTFTQLLVRVKPEAMADQARIAAAVTAIVRKQDPSVPISDVATWQQALAPVLFPARAASVALGLLGGLALLLAVTGIFGLASYAVSKRMREFGIRVALGAARGDVVRAAVGRVAKITMAGSLAGIVLGLASSRVLAAVVYGASASDPVVLVAMALTMAAVGCAAAALPARRALAVDPAMLLREE